MQDEVNSQIVSIAIRMSEKGARLTAESLQKAIRQFLQEKQNAKQGSHGRSYRGKQSVRHLMEQNTQLTNIEVTDQNIGSFNRIAKKYGIDYSLKKDKTTDPPRYLVFFKARDVDVMTSAFKEYSSGQLKKNDQRSIIHRLHKMIAHSKQMNKQIVKQKDRGMER